MIFPSTVTDSTHEEEKSNNCPCWEHSKKWLFLISAIVLGLFDVVTDWQNFIKYVSRPDDLREFIVFVAVLYFVFCCFIGTAIYCWDVWFAYREFKGYFDENVLSRDLELRDHVYKEKMYLSLATILLEDFPCFLLNFYIVYCDSPEDVEQPMFHLTSWQTLALVTSFVSVLISFARLLWLNYHYCRIFGCVRNGAKISSCCVWTNTALAYFTLAAMLYFFFGQFVPVQISFKVRQNKLAQERNQNIVRVEKTVTFEIHNIYNYMNKTKVAISEREANLFKGVYSNELKTMAAKGIWLRQNKRCSDIFYHVKPHIQINHKWNVMKSKFDISTTEYRWQWKGYNCLALQNSHEEFLMTTCHPLWFELEPVWCNFTYRILYDSKEFITIYNVANMTEKTCEPVHRNWITAVLREAGDTGEKRLSYCEKAGRKWKPVWRPELRVC